jgi:hypothetical protein
MDKIELLSEMVQEYKEFHPVPLTDPGREYVDISFISTLKLLRPTIKCKR